MDILITLMWSLVASSCLHENIWFNDMILNFPNKIGKIKVTDDLNTIDVLSKKDTSHE